jgi:hypothetical protein
MAAEVEEAREWAQVAIVYALIAAIENHIILQHHVIQ